MRLTLVRHGETVENANRIIQGQLPGVLSSLGWQQAEEAADALRNYHFDSIYYSDLERAQNTAEVIRKFHPLVPFIAAAALRERRCGDNEGKPFDRLYWESLPGDLETKKYPGGESWADVRARTTEFLNILFARHGYDELLLVSHGGPVRAIRSELEHRPLADIMHEGTPNGGIWHAEMLTEVEPVYR